MTILANAISSIEVGIEDYQDGSDKRNISAVRNIFAGILLLFKEKLVRLSPANDQELLIKKIILPLLNEDNEIEFKGVGKNTVDVTAIKERFNSLMVSVDWKRLEDINKLRNDLEHYYTKESAKNIREVLAKSFLVIRDFLVNELKEDPTELIDIDCWNFLLEIEEVYSVEERACKESFNKVEWKYDILNEAIKYIKCSCCDSSLVKFKEVRLEDVMVQCMSCGECVEAYFSFEQCINDLLGIEAYLTAKDGGDSPYEACPECSKDTFIVSEKACIYCHYALEYEKCEMCEVALTLDDQDLDGLCSYCNHRLDKVMRE